MIPVDQLIMHEPEKGQHGDCMRACIASLLELRPEDVPHFNEGGPRGHIFDERVADFLAGFGLVEITMPVDAWERAHFIRDTYHLIYGYTPRGTYHAAVGKNGVLCHDPHPSKSGFVEDKPLQLAFLVHSAPPAATKPEGGM